MSRIVIYEISLAHSIARTEFMIVEFAALDLDATFNFVNDTLNVWKGTRHVARSKEDTRSRRNLRDGPPLTTEQADALRRLLDLDAQRMEAKEQAEPLFGQEFRALNPRQGQY